MPLEAIVVASPLGPLALDAKACLNLLQLTVLRYFIFPLHLPLSIRFNFSGHQNVARNYQATQYYVVQKFLRMKRHLDI